VRVILVAASVVFLSGCMHHNAEIYSPIDQSDKSITVPPGSKGLKGAIKKSLAQNGWRLSVDRGPDVTEGEIGNKTRLENYDTFNTRYRLGISYHQYDVCVNMYFDAAINYEISVIDNKTGTEVIALEGRGCEHTAVEKFEEVLAEKS